MVQTECPTLEDMTTKFSLEVPVHMHKKRHRSLSAAGCLPSDNTERFTEYLMPDRRWTPENVDMRFRGQIQQYHTSEQYNSLLEKREPKMAYGRISIELTPLTDVQRESVKSSIDGVTQTLTLDVPVHLNHDQEETIAAAGNEHHNDNYWVDFLVHDSYQRSMPENLRGALPSYINLRVSAEQYSRLVEKRKEQSDAFGRIVLKFEPLAKQG